MFNKALYYPWIEFNDMSWVKTSALYWEEISTIVPMSYAKYYKEDCKILELEGILKPLRVNSSTIRRSNIHEEVIGYFEKYEKYYSRLLSNTNDERLNQHIYLEKIDSRLHSFIESRYKIRSSKIVETDKYFANFYMTILANYLSKEHGLSLITDSVPFNSMGIDIMNNTIDRKSVV